MWKPGRIASHIAVETINVRARGLPDLSGRGIALSPFVIDT